MYEMHNMHAYMLAHHPSFDGLAICCTEIDKRKSIEKKILSSIRWGMQAPIMVGCAYHTFEQMSDKMRVNFSCVI